MNIHVVHMLLTIRQQLKVGDDQRLGSKTQVFRLIKSERLMTFGISVLFIKTRYSFLKTQSWILTPVRSLKNMVTKIERLGFLK